MYNTASVSNPIVSSDVNKDWTPEHMDKDKDLTLKDKDKDKYEEQGHKGKIHSTIWV